MMISFAQQIIRLTSRTPPNSIAYFGDNLIELFFSYLPPETFANVSGVCRQWRKVAQADVYWHVKFNHKFPIVYQRLIKKNPLHPINWALLYIKIKNSHLSLKKAFFFEKIIGFNTMMTALDAKYPLIVYEGNLIGKTNPSTLKMYDLTAKQWIREYQLPFVLGERFSGVHRVNDYLVCGTINYHNSRRIYRYLIWSLKTHTTFPYLIRTLWDHFSPIGPLVIPSDSNNTFYVMTKSLPQLLFQEYTLRSIELRSGEHQQPLIWRLTYDQGAITYAKIEQGYLICIIDYCFLHMFDLATKAYLLQEIKESPVLSNCSTCTHIAQDKFVLKTRLGELWILSLNSSQMLVKLKGEPRCYYHLQSVDNLLFGCGSSGEIFQWDLNTHKRLRSFCSREESFMNFKIVDDLIFRIYWKGKVYIQNQKSKKSLKQNPLLRERAVRWCTIQDNTIAIVDTDGDLFACNLDPIKEPVAVERKLSHKKIVLLVCLVAAALFVYLVHLQYGEEADRDFPLAEF